MTDRPVPIIVKRKKVIAGGHHGGAWKVAYADFVTAMMAFFLLMWLLGATTEKQRKGIADYFNPTVPINKVSGGGDGAFGGDSIFSENTLAENGTGAGALIDPATSDEEDDQTPPASDDIDPLAEIAKHLEGRSGDSLVSDLLQKHVVTRLTDEGLIVEIFDIPEAPLFTGEAVATPILKDLVLAIAEVFRIATNVVAVQGHTASVPRAARLNPVWERSSTRADEVRKLLLDAGLADERMQRVTGFADNDPVAADLLSVRNNRIEIILLRDRH